MWTWRAQPRRTFHALRKRRGPASSLRCFPARVGPHFAAVLCGVRLLCVVFCVSSQASLCGMMSALAQQAARPHGEAVRPLLRRRMRPGASVAHGAAHRHEGGVFGAGAPMHAAAVAAAISA